MQLEVISVIVSGLAIIMSSYFAFIANRTNKKVNQKDFEISENLKYDLLKLIATIRTMDFKAAISGHVPNISFATECESLNQLMISPSFLLMLQAIPEEERQMSEMYFHILSCCEKSNIPLIIIRRDCHYILDTLKDKVDFKGVLDISVIKAIHNLCEIESVVDSSYSKSHETGNKQDSLFESFIDFLIEKGVKDEDVNVFHSIFHNDTDALKAALDNGGNPNVTQGDILKKYPTYLEDFNKQQA